MKTILSISMLTGLIFLVHNDFLFAQNEGKDALDQLAQHYLGKWNGEGTTPDDIKFKSNLNFEWTLNEHFLIVKNDVSISGTSELAAVTYYGWQPVLKQITFWSFDKDGTFGEGVATLEDNTLKHNWRSFSSNGEIKDWESSLTLVGSTELVFAIQDNKSLETYMITYKKTKN